MAGTTNCPVGLTGEALAILQAEKEKTGASMASILREYTIEHIKQRDENVQALANGQISGSLADQIVGLEARLSATVSQLDKSLVGIERSVNINLAMLDTFVKLYLLHTPSIPEDMQAGAAALTMERYKKFMRSLESGGFRKSREKLMAALDAAMREVESAQ